MIPPFCSVYKAIIENGSCYFEPQSSEEAVVNLLQRYGTVDSYTSLVPEGEVYGAIWNNSSGPLPVEFLYSTEAGGADPSGRLIIGPGIVVMWNPDSATLVPLNDIPEQSYQSFSVVPDPDDVDDARHNLDQQQGPYGMPRFSRPRFSAS